MLFETNEGRVRGRGWGWFALRQAAVVGGDLEFYDGFVALLLAGGDEDVWDAKVRALSHVRRPWGEGVAPSLGLGLGLDLDLDLGLGGRSKRQRRHVVLVTRVVLYGRWWWCGLGSPPQPEERESRFRLGPATGCGCV